MPEIDLKRSRLTEVFAGHLLKIKKGYKNSGGL